MARTALVSGPLSFLIVALAAVFLNPGPMDHAHPGEPKPGIMVDEVGPPKPEIAPNIEPESPARAEVMPTEASVAEGEAVRSTAASAGLQVAAGEGGIREP